MRSLAAWAAVVLLLGPVSACGASSQDEQDVTIRVFAASSLTESFTALAQRFEQLNPGTTVQLNFGPSSGLAQQIESGAPADVFASASPVNMDTLVAAGRAADPKAFAVNSMEIAVPPANPAGIEAVQDLARKDVKVALCQPQVPCGKVAAEVFARAGLTVRPATEEVDVKSVLTKVRLGEVDAGLVYVSDVRASGGSVTGIEIPDTVNASTTYPIATLTGSDHASVADQFVELVLSGAGAQVLEAAGFQRP